MRSPLHITTDKREIKDLPKLPSATSFIRKALAEMLLEVAEDERSEEAI